MKIRVPQSSEYDCVRMLVVGPDFSTTLEVSTELQEIERNFDVDERLLSIAAQYLASTREPVGPVFSVKDAEVVSEPESEPEPEEKSDEETEELAEEPRVEAAEEPRVEADEEPVERVEKSHRQGCRYGS